MTPCTTAQRRGPPDAKAAMPWIAPRRSLARPEDPRRCRPRCASRPDRVFGARAERASGEASGSSRRSGPRTAASHVVPAGARRGSTSSVGRGSSQPPIAGPDARPITSEMHATRRRPPGHDGGRRPRSAPATLRLTMATMPWIGTCRDRPGPEGDLAQQRPVADRGEDAPVPRGARRRPAARRGRRRCGTRRRRRRGRHDQRGQGEHERDDAEGARRGERST